MKFFPRRFCSSVLPFMHAADDVTQNISFKISPIGVVQSSYTQRLGTPKQATILKNKVTGVIEIFPDFRACLIGLDKFDYVWVISYMHLNSGFRSQIRPMPNPEITQENKNGLKVENMVGLFSTRAPHRPNPIAISALKIVFVDVEKGIIEVDGLDLLNKTPVIDVKPYVSAFDSFPDACAGWMSEISQDSLTARNIGYQEIVSKRGVKATKMGNKKRALNEAKRKEVQNESNSDLSQF